jgi:hypothetical protein
MAGSATPGIPGDGSNSIAEASRVNLGRLLKMDKAPMVEKKYWLGEKTKKEAANMAASQQS